MVCGEENLMVFDSMNILFNKTLDKNKMKEKELYLFKTDGRTLAAWLEKDEVRLKKVENRR